MVKTVGDLLARLNGTSTDLPVLVVDTRSGIVETVTGFGKNTFTRGDEEYGVDNVQVGDTYFAIYLG